MVDIATVIADWPGKSPAIEGGPRHSAVYHMLDVAAVAELLLESHTFPTALRQAMLQLICLHDLGKISCEFRDMLIGTRNKQTLKHWIRSDLLMRLHDREVLAANIGGKFDVRRQLYAAVSGHHGQPPDDDYDRYMRFRRNIDVESQDASRVLIDAVAECWPGASLKNLNLDEARRLSWWLAGLTTVADWVGSNTDWFQPLAPDASFAEYLSIARKNARNAVDVSGLRRTQPSTGQIFEFDPRPMQQICSEAVLPNGPTIAVIEDETGAGKTEAALMLAYRMIVAGKGDGLFIALPTMATADAMFTRIRGIATRLLDQPSLVLAHGKSALSAEFRNLVGMKYTGNDVTCASWLVDSRRKALLAQIGVGTVDQALMAALPCRYSTMRYWGLCSKILIVDEVHELGDPYMQAELCALLEGHAIRGGSAILMTATLPKILRSSLVKSFMKGANSDAFHLSVQYDMFPVLGLFGKEKQNVQAVASPIVRRKAVRVERIENAASAVQTLLEASQKGAACVWVRNSVDGAIQAVEELHSKGLDAELLHARFAACDRKSKELSVISTFGKGGNNREGRVLIATQVVESSLDLDFDVMVSDLAPIAALAQRAGRLWRHMDVRPEHSRPVREPLLSVLAPDPNEVEDEHWLREVLDRGSFVYPIADQWRTARLLFRSGYIDSSHDLGSLIESVHGAEAIPVPPALENAECKEYGEHLVRRHQGEHNVVKWDVGYLDGAKGLPDLEFPTRLGVEQRVLTLALEHETGSLKPWAGDTGADDELWTLSEVSGTRRRLDELNLPDQDSPTIRDAVISWPKWKQRVVRLCPVSNNGVICNGLRYDRHFGLRFDS